MKRKQFSIIFILIFIVSNIFFTNAALTRVGSNFLKPYATNKGETTFYRFQFLPDNEIQENATIQVIFPTEFDVHNFVLDSYSNKALECALAQGSSDFQSVQCFYSSGGVVKIQAGTVLKQKQTLVIGEIINPSGVASSSSFRISTHQNDVIVDRNDGFGTVAFAEVPGTILSPTVNFSSNQRISEGSTYIFTFQTSQNYYGQSTIRFTFPSGYDSQKSMCELEGLYGENPNTLMYHNKRIATCVKAGKDILSSETQQVKVINMLNPPYAGNFEGFKIEIMDGDSSIVLEQVEFLGTLTILPGLLSVTYKADAAFKWAPDIGYGFMINLVNQVNQNGELYLTFDVGGDDWGLWAQNCTIISGVNELADSKPTCSLTDDGLSYKIQNFQSIGPEQRVVVQIDLESPHVLGDYDVEVSTYDAVEQAYIDQNIVKVSVNDTYGINERWRIHPINAPIKLKAGETGPLELTFFLKNELPQTNVGTTGRFRIEVFPPIQKPPNPTGQIGTLNCDFYAEIDAESCIFITDQLHNATHWQSGDGIMEKTTIYVNTPENYSFKESEIPITIGSQGASAGYSTGITIDNIVKRYLFHIFMYDDNSFDVPTDVPKEYYFCEFVSDPFDIDDADITASVSHLTASQYTYLTVEVTQNQFNQLIDEYWVRSRNYKIRVLFNFNNAWQSGSGSYLGWTQDIYIEHPCLVYGTMTTSSNNLRCDLYALSSGSRAFIDVYGFQTDEMDLGQTIKFEIPKLKLGSQSNYCYIDVYLVEETPGMQDEHVVLLQKLDINLGLVKAAVATTTSGSVVQTNNIINKVSDHTYTLGTFTTGGEKLVMQLPLESSDWPALTLSSTIFGDYILQTTCGAYSCNIFGDLVGQIVIDDTFGTSVTVPVNGVFTNPPYEGTWTVTAQMVKSQAITQSHNIVISISAETMTAYTFACLDTAPFYSEHEYLFKVTFDTVNEVKADGGLELSFTGVTVQQTDKFYCLVTGLTQLTEAGVNCYIQGTDTLVIDNLDVITAGTSVTVEFYLEMPTSDVTPQVDITTYWESALTHRVDFINSVSAAAMTITLDKINSFEVNEVPVIEHAPYIDYTGPLEFEIDFSNTVEYFHINLEGFTYPLDQFQPLNCWIDNVQKKCVITTNTYLRIDFSDSVTAGSHTVYITTEEASPFNGITWPSDSRFYRFSVYGYVALFEEYYSTYIFVNPKPFHYLDIQFLTQSENAFNVFTINFQTTEAILAYDATASTGGRIWIEFPTVDRQGNSMWDSSIDGSSDHGDSMGCYVISGLVNGSGGDVSCLLIESRESGLPAYIEVIYFDAVAADTVVEIMVGKVLNPSSLVNVRIGVLTFNFDGDQTGDAVRTYLNYQDFIIFADIQSDASNADSTNTYSGTNTVSFNTGDFSTTVALYNRYWYDNTDLAIGDIFIVQLPTNLPLAAGDNPECNTALYDWCRNMHGIQWIIFKAKTAYTKNASDAVDQDAHVEIDTLPICVPPNSENVYTYIYSGTIYQGKVVSQLTASGWANVQKSITTSSASIIGNTDKYKTDLDNVEYLITFTVPFEVPEDGSVAITFDSAYQNVYPRCRSAINSATPSMLYSQLGANVGDLNCEVQNGKTWVLTGFSALANGDTIAIVGKAQNPNAGMTPSFDLTLYGNYDADLSVNGCKIAEGSVNLDQAIAANTNLQISAQKYIFKSQTYITAGIDAPFTLKTTFDTSITAQTGDVTIYFPSEDIAQTTFNGNGFIYDASVDAHLICYFQEIATGDIIGCTQTSSTVNAGTVNQALKVVLVPGENLSAGSEYLTVLTSQNNDSVTAYKGLLYPNQIGIYKILISTNADSSVENLFMEVYGGEFQALTFKNHVYNQNEFTLLDIEVQPNVQIDSDDLLVIEIATQTSDSQSYFDQTNVSYGIYEDIVFDLVVTDTITQCDCKYFPGSVSQKLGAKIVCTNFSDGTNAVDFDTSKTLRFIFKLEQSITASADELLFVPIFIYSFDPDTTAKANFNLITQSLIVKGTDLTNTALTAGFSLTSTEFDATADLTFNAPDMGVNDSFVLLFNTDFPKPASVETHASGFVVHAFNCKSMIFTVSAPITASTITVTSITNQDHTLSTAEKEVYGYLSQPETKITTKYAFTGADDYPDLTFIPNEIATLSISLLHTSITEYYQLNDLVIQFDAKQFDVIKKLVIFFPAEFVFVGTDCAEYTGSGVVIDNCYIDTTNNYMWLEIYDDGYDDTLKTVIVQTRNIAFQNYNAAINLAAIEIKGFRWEGDVQPTLDPTTDDYVQSSQTGFAGTFSPPFTTTISGQLPNYFDLVYEKYIQEVLYYDTTQTAPLMFDYVMPQATTGGQSHQIIINYPSQLTKPNAVSSTTDVYRYKDSCFINGIYKDCVIDDTADTITIDFEDAFTLNQEIFIKVTVIDPLTYPENEGFSWTSATTTQGDFVFTLSINSGTTVYKTPLTSIDMFQKAGLVEQFSNVVITQQHTEDSLINYLQFQFDLASMTTLDYFVFEFKTENIYTGNSGTILGLTSGERVPCSNNSGDSIYCIIETGSDTEPFKIFVTGIPAATSGVSVNFLFENPTQIEDLEVIIYHYTGTTANTVFTGQNLLGKYVNKKVFTTQNGVVTYTTATDSIFELQGPLTKTVDLKINNPTTDIVDQSVSLLKLLISGDGINYCNIDGVTQDADTQINYLIDNLNNKLFAYIAYKHSATVAASGFFTISGIKCDYFPEDIILYNLQANSGANIYEYTSLIDGVALETQAALANIFVSNTILYSSYIAADNGHVELNLIDASALTSAFTLDNDMVMTLEFKTTGDLFATTLDYCSVIGGATNSDHTNQPITCLQDSNSKFVIRNFKDIVNLNLLLQVSGFKTPTGVNTIEIIVYQNEQTYSTTTTNGGTANVFQPLAINTLTLTLDNMVATSAPQYYETPTVTTDLNVASDGNSIGVTFQITSPVAMADPGGGNFEFLLAFPLFGAWGGSTADINSSSLSITGTAGTYSFTNSDATIDHTTDYNSYRAVRFTIPMTSYINFNTAEIASTDVLTLAFTIQYNGIVEMFDEKQYQFMIFEMKDGNSNIVTSYFGTQSVSVELGTGGSINSISNTISTVTELEINFTTNFSISPTGKRLVMEFTDGAWDTYLIKGTDNSGDYAYFPCICNINSSGNTQQICQREISYQNHHSQIVIVTDMTASAGQTVNCFIPFVKLPSTTGSWNVNLYLDSNPQERYIVNSQQYKSLYYYPSVFTIADSGTTVASPMTSIIHGSVTAAIGDTGVSHSVTVNGITATGTPYLLVMFYGDGVFSISNTATFVGGGATLTRTYSYNDIQGAVLYFSSAQTAHNEVISGNIDLQNYRSDSFESYAALFTAGNSISQISSTTNTILPTLQTASISQNPIFDGNNYEGTLGKYLVKLSNIQYASFDFKSALILTIDTPTTFNYCSATLFAADGSDSVILSCFITSTSPYVVKIAYYEDGKTDIDTNSKINVVFYGQNPATDVDLDLKVYKEYTDASTYQIYAESSTIQISVDTSLTANYYDSSNLNIYEFRPKIFGQTNNPMRFIFKNTNAVDQSEYLEFYINDASYDITSNPRCYVREIQSTGTFIESLAECTFAANKWTVQQPYDFYMNDVSGNTYYEIILATENLADFGTPNPDQAYYFEVSMIDSGSNYIFYKNGQGYYYQGNNVITMNQFYYSSNEEDTQTYLFINIDINEAHLDTDIQNSYLEFEFEGLVIADFFDGSYIAGQEIQCGLSSTFTQFKATPICRLSHRFEKSTNAILSVEYFGAFTAGDDLTIAFEDIVLPDSLTDKQEFSIKVVYRNGDDQMEQNFKQLFLIDPTVQTVASTGPYTTANPSDTKYGALSQTYQTTISSWPFTQSVNTGNKIAISVDTSGGPFSLSTDNDFTSAVYTLNSATLTLLYFNQNTGILVFQAIALTASSSYDLTISSLRNPYISELATYTSSPGFKIESFTDFEKVGEVSLNYPPTSVFTPLISALGISISTANNWVDDQIFKIELTFTSDLGNTLVVNENLSYYNLEFVSAGTEIIDCLQITGEISNFFTVCTVIDATNLRISGLADIDFDTNQDLTLTLLVRMQTNNQNIDVNLYNSDDTLFNQESLTGITIPNYSTENCITEIISYNRKYTQNFYEPIETKLYAGDTTEQLFIEYTAVNALTYASSHQIEIEFQNTEFEVTSAGDEAFLNCFWFTKNGEFDYGKAILASSCSYAAGVYTLVAPIENLPAANYLIQIDINQFATAQTFDLPAAPQRNEILITETTATTATGTEILNALLAFDSVTILHQSMTRGYYDFPTIEISPSIGVSTYSASSEMKIIVELDQTYYGDNAGYDTVFSDANLSDFVSGSALGFIQNPADGTTECILQEGSSAHGLNFQYQVVMYPALTASTSYSFKFPKLFNPSSGVWHPRIKVYIELCDAGESYCYKLSEYDFISQVEAESSTPGTMTAVIQDQGTDCIIQSTTCKFQIALSGMGSLTTSHFVYFDWDNSEDGIKVTDVPTYTFTGYNINYYKYLNTYELIPTATYTSPTNLQVIGNLNAQDFQENIGVKQVVVMTGQQTTFIDSTITDFTLGSVSGMTAEYERVGDSHYERVGSNAKMFISIAGSAKIPVGSKMILTFDAGSKLLASSGDYGAFCYPGQNIYQESGKTLYCYKSSTDEYTVEGFQEIASGTDFVIYFFVLQNNSGNPEISFKVVNEDDKLIYEITSITNPTPISVSTSSTVSDFSYTTDYRVEPIYSESYGTTQFKLTVAGTSLATIDLIRITLPTTPNAWSFQDTSVNQYVQYLVGTDWITAGFTQTTNVLEISPHANYPFPVATEIDFRFYTTLQTSDQNSLYRPEAYLYNFIVEIEESSVIKEIMSYDYELAPMREQNFEITAFQTHPGLNTPILLEYTLNYNIAVGDEIWIEFTTNNGLFDEFADNLGGNANDDELDCVELSDILGINGDTANYLKCYLVDGDDANKKKSILKIIPSQAVTAPQAISVYVGGLTNPSNSNQGNTIVLSQRTSCRADGLMCVIAESSDFYYTQGNPSTTTRTSTLTQTLGTVLDLAQTHAYRYYRGTNAITVNDFVFYQQVKENHEPTDNYTPNTSCTKAGGICVMFPLVHWILFTASACNSGTSCSNSISGMNNGWYAGDNWCYIQTLSGTNRNILVRDNIQYYSCNYTPITAGITANVNATQSSQDEPAYTYWVRGFDNIMELNIMGLWLNNDVESFGIQRPSNVQYQTGKSDLATSYDGTYCNATLSTSPTGSETPMPYRFECRVQNDQYINIKKLRKSTEELDGWNFNIIAQQYYLKIYTKLWVPETTSGTTNNFYIYAMKDSNFITPNYYKSIARASHTIDVSTIYQPDLSDVTFNTLSFYDRKARLGDQVEYYMLLEPKTNPVDYTIDKLVFRLPDEFGYPALAKIDACKMIGKSTIEVTDCSLDRIDGQTFATLIPPSSSWDDHAVKIVRISFLNQVDLFTAPTLPGDFYNVTLSMWSGDTLVEKTHMNMTDVLGEYLDVAHVVLDPGLDAETLNMFEFVFQTGEYTVYAGYQDETTTIWSRIHFNFETELGYENDLGTGFIQNQELGCVARYGLSTDFIGRLKCYIDLGTSSENKPELIVEGYDEIAPNTDISILITGIKTLPTTKAVTVSMGVELVYVYLGDITAYMYDPTPAPTPDYTTAYTGAASTTPATDQVVASGDLEVLGYSDYTFTLTTGASGIPIDDYIAFQFPEDFFEKYSDYTEVTCAQASEIYVFGASNMIYLKPLAAIPANTLTSFTIVNLINPAYKISETIVITGFTYVGGDTQRKQETSYEFYLTRQISPCSIFTEAQAVASTYLGGENDVTIEIEFMTGHPVPENGAVSVFFPESYAINLLELGAYCAIKLFDLDGAGGIPTCRVATEKRVDILMNGYLLDKDTLYSFEIFGVSTLNVDSVGLVFTIASFYTDNVYRDKRICEIDFDFPVLSAVESKVCDLLSFSSLSNTNLLSTYEFQFQCPEPIKKDTNLQIQFPDNYKQNNNIPQSLECKSQNTGTLKQSTCYLIYGTSGEMILSAFLQQIQSQVKFTIIVDLYNPDVASTYYQFSADFISKQFYYLKGKQDSNQYVSIYQEQETIFSDSSKTNVQLLNLPKNAGEAAKYIFTIPPLQKKPSQVNQLNIQFPKSQKSVHSQKSFAYNLGHNLSCGVYISENLDQQDFSYHSLLELTQLTAGQQEKFTFSGTYEEIECAIIQERVLAIYDVDELYDLYQFDKFYYSFIISGVNNPGQYVAGEEFELSYLADGVMMWQHREALVYQVSENADLIKMKSIAVSDENVKNNAVYQFEIDAFQNIQQISNLGISIQLPTVYSDVVVYQDDTKTCTLTLSGVQLTSRCALYGLELFMWDIANINLVDDILKITVDSLINPVPETSCEDLEETENYYVIRLLNLDSNDIVYSTSPSVDDENCVQFYQNQFNIDNFGSSIVYPGQSYVFTITLAQPGDGLKITPESSVNGIKFDPPIISFESFAQISNTYQLKVRSDVNPGTYFITFSQSENSGDIFYSQILPFKIQVKGYSSANSYPKINIGNFQTSTIGYPVKLPFTLTSNVATTVNLKVEIDDESDGQFITFDQYIYSIDSSILSGYFEMTILTNYVPKSVKLNFSLQSYYPTYHQLSESSKIITFSRTSNGMISPPSLYISVGDDDESEINEIGQQVFSLNQISQGQTGYIQTDTYNQLIEQILPTIYEAYTTEILTNQATIKCLLSQDSYIYYTYTYQGSRKPDVLDVIHQNYTFSLGYGILATERNFVRNIDFETTFTLENLIGQSNYDVHLVAVSGFGYSQLHTVQFKTDRLSYGIVFTIPILQLVTEAQLITAMSKTLRVTEDRLIIMRSQSELENEIQTYDNLQEFMINPKLYYEIALAPNQDNDDTFPEEYGDYLSNQSFYQNAMKNLLPEFDLTRQVTWRQIRQTTPGMQIEPYQQQLTCYTANIGLRLWEKGNVYGVVIETSSLDYNLYSNQIFRGTNEYNENLSQYKIYSGTTDNDGTAYLIFDDLVPNTQYTIFITVGGYLPYEPLVLYDDDKIITFEITTPYNINLGYDIGYLEYVKQGNSDLYEAISKRYIQ